MSEQRRLNRLKDAAGLAGWIVLCFAAAAVGGAATAGAPGFFGELSRPSWAPPAWIFGPVWTVLYLMMGLSAWTAWRERAFGEAPAAFGLFFSSSAQTLSGAGFSFSGGREPLPSRRFFCSGFSLRQPCSNSAEYALRQRCCWSPIWPGPPSPLSWLFPYGG